MHYNLQFCVLIVNIILVLFDPFLIVFIVLVSPVLEAVAFQPPVFLSTAVDELLCAKELHRADLPRYETTPDDDRARDKNSVKEVERDLAVRQEASDRRESGTVVLAKVFNEDIDTSADILFLS